MLRELAGAARRLRRAPRFTALAVGAFAVGIGANTTVFTLVDDLLLDPLPFPRAERAVTLFETHASRPGAEIPAAPAKVSAWADRDDLFRAVGAWRLDRMDLISGAAPERIQVGRIDPGVLPALGVEPGLGRGFTAEETVRGQDDVALLPHRTWVERAGASPDVLGSTLVLDGRAHTVVGVLPPGTAWPVGAEVVVPLVVDVPESRSAHAYRVVAGLADGVDIERVRRELTAAAARLAAEFPETDADWGVSVRTLRDATVGELGTVLLLFQGTVALVLLIACANVAGLLLVRNGGRGSEIALRRALGASRGRLLRELSAETLVLVTAGSALGLAMAGAAGGLLVRTAPPGLLQGAGTGLDASVLLVTVAVSVGSGFLFGLLPALRGAGTPPMALLRGGAATTAGGPGRLRQGVVAGQIALATVLAVTTVLLVRSLVELARVERGFQPRGLLAATVEPPRQRYPTSEERRALYDAIRDAVGGAPGVADVALASHIPLGGRFETFRFVVEGRPPPASQDALVAQIRAVGPGYARVVGMPLLDGRGIGPEDDAGAPRAAVVNAALARRYWPGEEVVGQRIGLSGPDGPWITVVGVVGDVRSLGASQEPVPELFVPLAQEPWPRAEVIVRGEGSGDPLALVAGLRRAVGEVDPRLPLASVRTLDALVDRDLARWRFQAGAALGAGGVAAGLAIVGIVGLLGQVVHERRRELVLRRALGARRADLHRLVVSGAVRVGAVGAVLGLASAAVGSSLLRSAVYGVGVLDPSSYLLAGAVVVGLTVAAASAPVRRAGAVEPAEVLRDA